jgi:4-hydroxy-tetrahydrodipicolinate reductase
MNHTLSSHRIAIAGASGRMGQMLIEAVNQAADCQLAGALDIAASASLGKDASAFTGHNSGVLITADLATGIQNAHALIDFTRPEGTLAHHAPPAATRGVNLVIGTTGFSDEQKQRLPQLPSDISPSSWRPT